MGLVGTVVDAAIGWLVQSILASFFTAQMEAWTREVGLAEDVEKLKSEMSNVKMVLAAADGSSIDNKPLAESMDKLKYLLYDAEDVMDELDYYRLQQHIEEGEDCRVSACTNLDESYTTSSTSSFQLVCNTVNRAISWASLGRKRKREEELIQTILLPDDIKIDISERINRIVNHLHFTRSSVQEVLHLELSRCIATSNQNQCMIPNMRLTTSVPIECKVYGRDAERNKVIELLISGKSSDLHVLPLVGIGGVGKTTLAKFVYCDQRIKDHFDLQIWLCVSTNFNEVNLTLEILEHICKDRQEYADYRNFNVLQEILLKNINNKRFLLVMDDMWEYRDRRGWDNLLAPLKRSQANGCKILATTRRKSVAKMIGTMDEVEVNGIDEKEFWLFFKLCAFGNENHEGDPSLQSIGKQIVKSLKGCPLAARSVGALLNTSITYEHWKAVSHKWKFLQENDDDILPILKLSYDYLPVHLQRCFSYCSLFPEDHHFNGKKLVHAWISQNFVQGKDSTKRLEELGKQYLDNLVDLGFFQKVDSHYVMHDLMHELAEKVSSNECATIKGSESESIQSSVCHLSIKTTSYDKEDRCNFPSKKFENILQNIGSLGNLRTLMFFGRSSINLLGPLQAFCKQSKSLRFLRIYVTGGADFSSMHDLLKPYHLRYLEFIYVSSDNMPMYGDFENNALPQVLTKYYHLQVLDVSNESNLAVPTAINNLINLRHIVAHEKVLSTIAHVGSLSSLQELKFKVQNSSNFGIRQLQSMNQLVSLGVSQLQNVKTKEEASSARLVDKEHLDELTLSWNYSISHGPTAENVLEGLEPHQNLKHLQIIGYNGCTSPIWLASNVSVTSLQTLHLQNCKNWHTLPSLQMLPLLRKLALIRMWNMMEISIPSLEELILVAMPKLEKCVGTYGLALTSQLKLLMIKDCPQLKEFTLFQSYCTFQSEQKSWFPSLNKLTIGHCPHIINWEILPLGELQSLKELMLMNVHVIRELLVPCLEKLVLIQMPSLESCRGLAASPPLRFSISQGDKTEWVSSLRTLTIHDCPCLIVSHPLPPSDMISDLSVKGVPTFPTLQIIGKRELIIESNELSLLDDKVLAFHNLGGITSLQINNCPRLIFLSREGFSQLTDLNRLVISNCPNLLLSHIMSKSDKEDGTPANILVLPSLKSMEIWSCGITGRWLTQVLSHSLSLEGLTLGWSPHITLLSISEPPEAEENGRQASAATVLSSSAQEELVFEMPSNLLSSLKQLSIYSDIVYRGGKGVFRGFTSLEELRISRDCSKPLLGETKDDGTVDETLLPPSLQELSIAHLPANMQSYIPRGLKKLMLSNCPYLKRVQLQSCPQLEELQIRRCEQLAVLDGLEFLTSLKRLEIDPIPQEQEHGSIQISLLPPSIESLSIGNITDKFQFHLLSCLPHITKLKIEESPNLTSLQLAYCTVLNDLEITDCQSLASIEGFQSLRNLRSLSLSDSPRLPSCLDLMSQHQGACEILSRLETLEISDASFLSMSFCKLLTSLRRLRLFPRKCWGPWGGMVSLTEEQDRALQLLTSLQTLEFQYFGNLLSLPASIHSLASLEWLQITDCTSIARLPAMGLPPSLKRLDLCRCSEELCTCCRMAATPELRVTIDNLTVN